jgi:hypothetical protein
MLDEEDALACYARYGPALPVQTLRGSVCITCWKVKGLVVDKLIMTESREVAFGEGKDLGMQRQQKMILFAVVIALLMSLVVIGTVGASSGDTTGGSG